ncbi:MAG: DMT family transporter [Alphaproteobacteria bacterium]|nr:DMT family transporter [Alphaproteobacteria bacterium]
MSNETKGLWLGLLGVAIFALTLPFTRLAVREFDPLFLSIGRTVLAAAVAGPMLLLSRQPWPSPGDVKRLLFVVGGVIFGFPVFSALAMRSAPASHAAVVLAALPLATALMSTIFAHERPSPAFWFWSVLGSGTVIVFALWDGGAELHAADGLLVLAVFAAAMGYAAGGQLSKTLGGWQVICWALLLALPLTLPITYYLTRQLTGHESLSGWLCYAYLGLMSQLVGFFAWNKGLALGGIAKVGQVQLLQTFMSLAAAALILGETLSLRAMLFAVAVAICVWFGRKSAVRRRQ